MKIGFVILCRYNSSRLPGKILKEIQGKTILQYIIDSLSVITNQKNIVVATSVEQTDDLIVEYCNKNNIQVFRGDLNNVSKRFMECANSFGFDYVTRINGDNIFVDQSTIQEMLVVAKTGKYDFISNVKNRTFPKGMSVEIVHTKYYNEVYQSFESEDDFEHVTINLYQNDEGKNYFYFYNEKCKEAAGLQFAIDTQEDFVNAQRIIKKLNKNNHFTIEEIYRTFEEINEE